MATCKRKQGCQMRPKLTVRKETISDTFLGSLKSVLHSRKELCRITEDLKCLKKENVIELTFLELSEEFEPIQDLTVLHLDLPELIRSLHLCSLSDYEVILLKDVKDSVKSCPPQGRFPGAVCVLSSPAPLSLRRDAIFSLMSKYLTGIRYTLEQHCMTHTCRKSSHSEDDDTNQSVSSIEDDFVTAFEHLDEEELANGKQEREFELRRSQHDAASQTQPTHCIDICNSKIMFSSLSRRSSLKSATLSFIGMPHLPTSVKNTVTASVCDSWRQNRFSVQDKTVFTPPAADSSESECSSPSPVIFLDEEGYQKSMTAKLNLPKIPVLKDGIEDSDSELSEFFDSFDQFDETCQESNYKPTQKNGLTSPPKKRKRVAMNPQKFKSDLIFLSANVKKPTPLKPDSPFNSTNDVPDSPRPINASVEDTGALFSPIRSSAFSPLVISTSSDYFYPLECNDGPAFRKDKKHGTCGESVLNTKSSNNNDLSKKGLEKSTKLKRKSYNKESERKMKSKHKPFKNSIQKFASELVERSLVNAFKDLQKGVSSCTSALCQLAARLTSYVFQMAFFEIRRMQAFSIKKRAINSLANLMVNEVISSALQELRYIKKQMVANAVTRFAADLAEELVFEGMMEVCQFSHPPTPTTANCRPFEYDDVAVTSYAKDLSESVIQEAFIELSQVNVTFTTQAAISVCMDNLKYVSSGGMMQSTQTSISFPILTNRIQTPLAVRHDPQSDYTVQHALLYTSSLVSSVSVPVAAKALNLTQISCELLRVDDCADVKSKTINSKIPAVYRDEVSSLETIIPFSMNSITNIRQEMQHLHFAKLNEDNENMKTFSVATMVDMIGNEASSKTRRSVEDYAECLVKKIVPSKNVFITEEQSKENFADDMAMSILQHSVGHASCTISDNKEFSKPMNGLLFTKDGGSTQDSGKWQNPSETIEKQLMISRSRQSQDSVFQNSLTVDKSSIVYEDVNHKSRGIGNSNFTFNDISPCCINSKINIQNCETSYATMFGLPNCLSHINNLSSVMCSCGDYVIEDKADKQDSNVTLPDTPPPTPLCAYEISSEKSLRILSKKLKGHLANEFYPATPPPTPHLTALEQDNNRKDEFLLKVMRSLSEEAESSCSDGISEDYSDDIEVPEETAQYADYLSTNILAVATEMAASHLEDRATTKNLPLLCVLSDKWGYPAYMRNISEETVDTLYIYASGVAGEVLNDAKKAIGKRQDTQRKLSCDTLYCNFRKHKDCKTKERGIYTYINSKEADSTTLLLPQNNNVVGLTSKYPSCESVTEEYADHIIRVLKMEGGNSELIIDQYASRLVYRAVKSGLQQASKSIQLRCNRKVVPRRNSEANSTQEILRLLSIAQHQEQEKQRRRSISNHLYCEEPSSFGRDRHRSEFTGLLHFADLLAQTITCDVRRKLKMSSVSLPKSLTDSCLYTKTKNDDITGKLVKPALTKTLLPYSQKNKLYHSTGSLNDPGFKESTIQAIEQYACKVVDSTVEFSMETARHQALENKKKNKVSYIGKLSHSYGPACRVCSAKEQQSHTVSSCHFLLGPDVSRKMKQSSRSKHNACQKSRLFHHNIPKIHLELDKRAIFAEKIVNAAIEKAERDLSNTSLACDSGIGHDGISFADSLTAEIMLSAMKNIGHAVNLSSDSKDGSQSAESVTSQQTSASVGDDSTGSWSNLSFEDDHQDESSSFLHLSDSNGNSSSWSSLGLEGDMYEENLSFPPSDSDGVEEKDEKQKTRPEGKLRKSLLIRNVDVGPYVSESQLRITLLWIVASEAGVSDLCFAESDRKEILAVARTLAEKQWNVGDLLRSVFRYCEITEKTSGFPKPLFEWLLENS